MDTIVSNNKYRVVIDEYIDFRNYTSILNFKVQIKILFLWITIKEFREFDYDDDAEFCKREAVELYNKIVNPYGKV